MGVGRKASKPNSQIPLPDECILYEPYQVVAMLNMCKLAFNKLLRGYPNDGKMYPKYVCIGAKRQFSLASIKAFMAKGNGRLRGKGVKKKVVVDDD